MNRVLILVQACDDPPYFDMQRAQRETWDSFELRPAVTTIYYYGNNHHKGEYRYETDTRKLYCPCPEAYDMMHYRHKLATEWCMENIDFDIMFRTNASSYVHKQKLFDYAQTLPTEKLFISNNGIPSGAGFFLSKDYIKLANEGIDTYPTSSEDQYIFTMLNRHGIDLSPGGDRVEFNHQESRPERECYHYRCKSDTADRNKDIIAFKKLFKQFHG